MMGYLCSAQRNSGNSGLGVVLADLLAS